jgi:hypothetical protein
VQYVGISTRIGGAALTTNQLTLPSQAASTTCTTMGAKKSKSGKKGPKGKKARAKAKLEQVWGEHVDEEARRQSKHRVGKSRFLSDSNNNSHAKQQQQRHNKNEKEVDPLSRNRRGLKSSFETFLERKDRLYYQNEHEERQKNYYAQKKNNNCNTVNNNDGNSSSSSSSGSDDDDSENEIDGSGINNGGGGSLSYLLKRIKGPKKSSSRKVVAAESDDDDDDDVSNGSDDSNDDDTDSMISSASSSQDDVNSESDVDMDSTEDEVEGYDVDITMPKGAAADPYEAHFSKQPLPQIDSTENTNNKNKNNNNLTPLIGKSVKVDTSSLLSSSMQVHLSGPLLDSWEALAASITKKVKSKHIWRAFTRGPQQHIRQVLGRNWNTINQSALKRGHQRGGSNSEQQGENEIRFSPLQQVLYPALSRYADVMISMETRQVRAINL